jgi:hypothetical protein
LENPGGRVPFHRYAIVEVPLHDQLPISIDVDMTGAVVSLPGEEQIAPAPDFAHLKLLPYEVTDDKRRVAEQ